MLEKLRNFIEEIKFNWNSKKMMKKYYRDLQVFANSGFKSNCYFVVDRLHTENFKLLKPLTFRIEDLCGKCFPEEGGCESCTKKNPSGFYCYNNEFDFHFDFTSLTDFYCNVEEIMIVLHNFYYPPRETMTEGAMELGRKLATYVKKIGNGKDGKTN